MALLLGTSMHVCTLLLWVAASSLMIIAGGGVAGQPEGPVVRQVEGPYWVDERGLERSDVTEGLMGLPLELTMQLMAPVPPLPPHTPAPNMIQNNTRGAKNDAMASSLRTHINSNVSGADDDGSMISLRCPPHPPPPLRPLVNAQVDIWHCSSNGTYSDAALDSTLGLHWLRGYQKTDMHGRLIFHTIYPGWYAYRTVHIHVRVRLFHNVSAAGVEAGAGKQAKDDGDGDDKIRVPVFDDTTQLYFEDALSDDIYAHVYPYKQRGQERPVRNSNDWLFNPSNLIQNITGHYNQFNTSEAAAAGPAGYKAYVILRYPFLPLLPPPPYT